LRSAAIDEGLFQVLTAREGAQLEGAELMCVPIPAEV
jgi:hypothetical protein